MLPEFACAIMYVLCQGLSGSRALLLNRNYTEDTQSMVHYGAVTS